MRLPLSCLLVPLFVFLVGRAAEAQVGTGAPAVGDAAPAVKLTSTDGEAVDLAEMFSEGKTVLVVLRGYPGYQCPLCSVQAAGFLKNAAEFRAAGASVVMVYPGPADDLATHAEEFAGGVMRSATTSALPAGMKMVMDPDYELVDAYGLRWDAPAETAYPSTFVVEGGNVTFAEISDSHGGRVEAARVLRFLAE